MDIKKQLEIIKRGTEEIISEEELVHKLKRALKTKTPLVVKVGFDPSAPDIHLGHTVLLGKMRHFQELGHQVIFLIGDFTGRIGDPTGRNEARPRLTEAEVKENARTYKRQVFKILDEKKTRVVFNSEWFKRMNVSDMLELASHSTVAQLLTRQDFRQRYHEGKDISILEFFYPLLQGYDSVELNADVEIGGRDQKFNLLIAREIQRDYGKEPEVIITTPLLEGMDGVDKMSKSLGNHIGIDESPNEMFGKIMSISDELMIKYYELLTDVPLEEIRLMKKNIKEGALHPKDAKSNLAYFIVSRYHSPQKASNAREEFGRVFREGKLPSKIPEFVLPEAELKEGKIWIVNLLRLTGLAKSGSEARRTIEGGAVTIDSQRIYDTNLELPVKNGMVLQVGKRHFVKVVISS